MSTNTRVDIVFATRTILAALYTAVLLADCDKIISCTDRAGRELYVAVRPLLVIYLFGNAYRVIKAIKLEVK